MNIIELKNIYKQYGKGDAAVHAINGIDLAIQQGELVAIVGPSGSGKSTLLNILGCIDTQSSGDYLFEGKPLENSTSSQLAKLRNEKFGFVIQDFALIEKYTVKKNISLPLDYAYARLSSREKNDLIDALLSKLGILEKKDTFANELSGGQRQRVAIARALINNPQVILADEPTGALDTVTGQEVLDVFKQINSEGKTVIIVTHDMSIADQCQRTIKLLDGKVVQ